MEVTGSSVPTKGSRSAWSPGRLVGWFARLIVVCGVIGLGAAVFQAWQADQRPTVVDVVTPDETGLETTLVMAAETLPPPPSALRTQSDEAVTRAGFETAEPLGPTRPRRNLTQRPAAWLTGTIDGIDEPIPTFDKRLPPPSIDP